ncbi:hypothetical protein [Pseudonocardia endophytica]|uniref:hypothetical protein n=1 Tax=Pseudonocardia endophytica TaxID=401976 RepID=UPI00104ED437|nr:hypothetical protein [Pseudonocardia endophytica]
MERGLRADVLPHVVDPHGNASLRAALTILSNIRLEIDRGAARDRATVIAALPDAGTWPDTLRTWSEEAADHVADLVARAEAETESGPALARQSLLAAAQLCCQQVWQHDADGSGLLRSVRRVLRIDAEAEYTTQNG